MNQTLLLSKVDQNYKYSRKALSDELRKLAIPKLIKELSSKIELYEEKNWKISYIISSWVFEYVWTNKKSLLTLKKVILKKQHY